MLVLLFVLSATLAAQQKTFDVEVKGNGDPVLLFPGFTCTGEVWKDVVEELSKTKE
jgi:hypothetical protein